MTICSFFLQGRCRYGEKCWNEHPRGGAGDRGGGFQGNRVWVNPQTQRSGGNYVQPSSFSSRGGGNDWGRGGGGGARDVKNFSFSSNQNRFSTLNSQSSFDPRGSTTGAADENDKHLESIQRDMEVWQSSGQWAFSCYSVLKASISGFVELSPEELRMEYYTSRASGLLQSYANSVQQLTNQWRSRLQELRNMSSSTRTAMISELNNPGSQSPSVGGFLTSSSGFGSSSTSGFGSGGFGPSAQENGAGGFSFASSSPGFTVPSSQPAQSGFGSAGSQPAQSGFGSAGSQPAQSGFGSAGSQPAQSGFGSAGSQPSASEFGGFGSVAPSSTPTASTFSFAAPVASKSSSGGFGSAAGFSFTSSTAPAGGSLFSSAGTGGFGGPAVSAASGELLELLFTPQSELTPEELREFTAKRFTLGQIPLRPPPAELLTV